jgi:aspartyl-tRNA(Asn)/glutamyl-tRNA(Gln) amidotransferase subunit B
VTKLISVLDRYPEYETTIGIEVHVQLATKSKIFCSCANRITKEPNSNICNICAGYPGALPVLNKAVINYAIAAGLATNCSISPRSTFDRKHYFYPDLPKNYQITQQYLPICLEGFVPIRLEDGSIKNIRLIRIHIEEDAGKNIHSSSSNESFVDLNRAGTPLLEMVSYPDISSSYEARTYLKALRSIVQYLQICSGNMEEGAFRADTNISVRKKGAEQLGTKVELKNINSFKFISDATDYEIERQIELLEGGSKVKQETRLWDDKNNKTISMRSKEEAADYRFFQDPDLPIVVIDNEQLEQVRASMPELPHDKFDRFVAQNGLSPYEAEILIEDRELANYYEKAFEQTGSKQIVNWVLRDVMGYLKEHKIELNQCKVTPEKLAAIVTMLEDGKINGHAAKEVFAVVATTGGNPADIVKEKGLEQIGSKDELTAIVKEILAAHPENVALYKSGKDRVFGFFVGQAMQKTQGKGDPKVIQDLLKKYLSE